MTNSADPDPLASSYATDLDLHCLQRPGHIGDQQKGGLINQSYQTDSRQIKN